MFKDIIKDKNITCYELSKISGVSYTAVNEIYRGEREIDDCSLKVVMKIASALNMKVEELYKKSKTRLTIPEELYKCFWDSDPSKLNLLSNRFYIVTRLLDQGGLTGFKFLKNAYSYEEIKEVAMHSRNFSPKIASFLKNVYNLNKQDMAFYKLQIQDWRK